MVNDYELVELTFAKLTATIETEFKEPTWPRWFRFKDYSRQGIWEFKSVDDLGTFFDFADKAWKPSGWQLSIIQRSTLHIEITAAEAAKLLNP